MGLQVGSTASGLRWPVGGSLFPDVFPDGFKDMMESVDSVLAKSKWIKPALTGDTPVTGLNESGLYPVLSSARAQEVGLPTSSMGFLEVLQGNDSYSKLTWIPMGTGTPWSRVRDAGTWGVWRPVDGSRGTIPANTDLDTVRGQDWAGGWDMPLAPTTNTLGGTRPPGQDTWLPGQFQVMGWAGGVTSLTSQLYMPYQKNEVWYRTIKTYTQNGALAWTPWVNLTAPAESGGSANALLIEDFTRRRGPVNTNGKGAVALRFDHGLANFNSKIRPLLESRNLPYSLALNSRSWDLAENTGVTASMVNSWVSAGLAEVWNHGAHHVDSTGTEALKDVIVTGLEELRSQLPAASIDGWAVPGVGGTNYDGFGGGTTPANFYGTEAGRLILANHAVSTGYFPGTAQRKLDGIVRQGMSHYTLDTVTGTAAQYQIDKAITDATGLQLMLHPSLVDQEGNVTTAKLVEILDYIVAKRDAGRLVVLSPYQLMLADAHTATFAEVDRRVAGTGRRGDLISRDLDGLRTVDDSGLWKASTVNLSTLSGTLPWTGRAFMLDVTTSDRTTYLQVATTLGSTLAERMWRVWTGSAWTTWRLLGTRDPVILGNVGLNTLTEPGDYILGTPPYSTTANNYPATMNDRAFIRVRPVGGNNANLIQVIETWTGSIYKRSRANGTAWGAWREFRPDVTTESVESALAGKYAAKADVLTLDQVTFETDKRYQPIGDSGFDKEALTAEYDARYATVTGANATFDETSLTARYDARYHQMESLRREAWVESAISWFKRTATNEAGEKVPYALIRKVYITRPNGAPFVDGLIDTNQDMNSTSSALALQALALYALHNPHRAADVLPLAEQVAGALIGLQHQDPNTARFGGIGLAPGYMAAGCLTAAQAGIGFLYAYKVWGNGNWLAAALRCGTFIETLINPNPVYQRIYGHNVIDVQPGMVPIADQVTAADSFRPTATGWNLTGVKFLYQLSEVTGDSKWIGVAQPARDFMSTIVTGGYDYFHTKPAPDGVAAGRVVTNWTNQASLDFQDNQWHRQGDAISPPNGTVGTDQLEYGLSALYETGYDLAKLRTAYEGWVSLPNAPSTSSPGFAPAYDGRVCLTGYIRFNSVVYDGASMAFGSYYDAQGAGELLKWKQEQYPDHYRLSLPIVQAVLDPRAGALLDENYRTWWGSPDASGIQQATQGAIPIAISAIGILETGPTVDKE